MSSTDYQRSPTVAADAPWLARRLHAIWETEPGLYGWLATVDHKQIGLRYIVTAFGFLLAGGIEALLMRLQLARPEQSLLNPEQYNQLFTMHGISMILLYASPVLSGFSNYLWPLLLGSRDMALPRLNAFSYWVYLCAGLFIYASFLIGTAPNDGWFNYPPYASKPFNPGLNIDFYALGMILLGISTTAGAVNFMVTVLRARCPGVSINRLPMMCWGTLAASAANLFAIPCVSLAFFMLWLERQHGAHFFDAQSGGQPLLWQHLFWMFGHPWVYVVVLPAMGIVSEALPTYCRRPIVGYTAVALSTIATMVLGFGVWTHHMFATGLPTLALSYFSGASFVITIPSAITVFAWVATIWTGRPVFTTAFLFMAGMIVMFVVGGVSGFMTAAVALDRQLTDTYFVVAHLHYVLIGINLLPVMAGIYHWFPKWTGRMLDERLGKWNFWTVFAGFNLAFFPMHATGLLGMPRRIYTYPADMGWNTLNLVTTIGALVLAVGVLLLIVNVVMSLRHGAIAGPNPWDGPSLEWSVPSPPPPYNFAVIPTVASREPLWEERLDEKPERSVIDEGPVAAAGREIIATTPLDGQPDAILKMPHDSLTPLLLALALTALFAAMLLTIWWLLGASLGAVIAIGLAWLWPRHSLAQRREPVP